MAYHVCRSLTLLAILSAAACVVAEPGGPLRTEVARLVEALDSASRADRDAAADALLKLGPAALTHLPEATPSGSAGGKDALALVRGQLLRRGATESLQASHTDLGGTHTVVEAFSKLSDQTGNSLNLSAIPANTAKQPVTIAKGDRSFWSLCDELTGKARLVYADHPIGGRLPLKPLAAGKATEIAAKVDGPFRIAISSIDKRPAPGGATLLRVNWTLRAEPRLRPLFAQIAPAKFSSKDHQGAALQPANPNAKLEPSIGGGGSLLVLPMDFELPAGADVSQIDFGGRFDVEMAAAPQPLVFENLTRPGQPTKRAADVAVTLRSVRLTREGAGHTAKVEVAIVYAKGGPAFDSYRTWMYHNDVSLETKSGRRIDPGPDFSTQQQGDGAFAIEYTFVNLDGELDDYRFVYRAPTAIVRLPVLFHFSQLATGLNSKGDKR